MVLWNSLKALAANNTVPPASTVTQHPAAHPVAPAAQPVASGVQPVVAGVQPVVPGGQPVVPGVQPVAPGVQPIVPGVQPVVPGVPPGVPLVQQFTTAPQCKCDDIDKCTVEMADLTEMCKKEFVFFSIPQSSNEFTCCAKFSHVWSYKIQISKKGKRTTEKSFLRLKSCKYSWSAFDFEALNLRKHVKNNICKYVTILIKIFKKVQLYQEPLMKLWRPKVELPCCRCWLLKNIFS